MLLAQRKLLGCARIASPKVRRSALQALHGHKSTGDA